MQARKLKQQQQQQQQQYNVFCYGTLEFPAVMKKIIGVEYPKESATLIDYARYLVKAAPYPGIVQQQGAITQGTLYHGLTAQQLLFMDEYEGSLYDRIESEVLTSRGELLLAEIYVVPLTRKHLMSNLQWDKIEFERLYMSEFFKIE